MTDSASFNAAVDKAIDSLNRKPIGGWKRTRTRAEARKERRIATRIAKSLPEDVRRYYTRKFNGSIEDAFARLISGSDHVCERCGCHHPEPRAVIAGLGMVGAVQPPQSQVVVNLFQNLGVRDENEMRELVERGRMVKTLQEAPGGDCSHFLEEGLALVEACLRMQPAAVPGVLERLGKLSGAVEVNGNGNGVPHDDP